MPEQRAAAPGPRGAVAIRLAAVAAFGCAIAVAAAEKDTAPTQPATARALKAGDVPTYAQLDKGERIRFRLHGGAVHTLELVDYGRTYARLLVDGRQHRITCRPQDLPKRIAGMRVGVDMTKAWSDRLRFSWFGLRKDCRLFLSDAARPVMHSPEGVYPLSPPPRFASGRGGGWLADRREARKDCHIGYDIYGPLGTKLLAIEDVVVRSVWVDKDYGRMIVVDLEGKRFHYRYLHLMKALVEKGRKLRRGDEVGLMGQTGYCPYPHLHLHMMLPAAGAKAGPPADAKAAKRYFRSPGVGAEINPGPYVKEMFARLDPKRLVDFRKVKLEAVDAAGKPVKYPHYYVTDPDGRTWDVGIHPSTAVAAKPGLFTFVAERKKLALRGRLTVAIKTDGQRVRIIMRKPPKPPRPETKPKVAR